MEENLKMMNDKWVSHSIYKTPVGLSPSPHSMLSSRLRMGEGQGRKLIKWTPAHKNSYIYIEIVSQMGTLEGTSSCFIYCLGIHLSPFCSKKKAPGGFIGAQENISL